MPVLYRHLSQLVIHPDFVFLLLLGSRSEVRTGLVTLYAPKCSTSLLGTQFLHFQDSKLISTQKFLGVFFCLWFVICFGFFFTFVQSCRTISLLFLSS